MNWNQINEKYPKAFWEWLGGEQGDEVISVSHGLTHTEVRYRENGTDADSFASFGNMSELKHMPYNFDKLGIHIDAYFLSSSIEVLREYAGQNIDKPFAVSVHWDEAWDSDETFPDRLSALKAGVEKAFEIREEQLNKL